MKFGNLKSLQVLFRPWGFFREGELEVIVVILTVDDTYIFLGDVILQPDMSVRFEYLIEKDPTPDPTLTPSEPVPIPEPTTLLLIGGGSIGIIGVTRWKRKNNSPKGEKRMKHIKTLLFVLVLLPLLVETASAAELRVITIGRGDGDVVGGKNDSGEIIDCKPSCTGTYEEGTLVQLKAIPDDDSRFVEWLVNGNVHEGAIHIDQKHLLVAARFELNVPPSPDDPNMYWYENGGRARGIIALDEVVVFLDKDAIKQVTSQEEYGAVAQEIAQIYHPQAEILDYVPLVLKRPEPVAKAQLPGILSALKAHQYVQEAGPVLYRNPKARGKDPRSIDLRELPTGNIVVWFPDYYTDDQIRTIEENYGLVRVRVYELFPTHVTYCASDPLEAIDLADRLYNSGLVERAYPDRIVRGQLLGPSNPPGLSDQWNLHAVHIPEAWQFDCDGSNCTGSANEVIAIVNMGLEINHQDLAPNIERKLCVDFWDGGDPVPEIGEQVDDTTYIQTAEQANEWVRHGTGIAGIAAASGFVLCGAAPSAHIAGFRFFLNPNAYNLELIEEALTLYNERIAIYNNSWPPPAIRRSKRTLSYQTLHRKADHLGKRG